MINTVLDDVILELTHVHEKIIYKLFISALFVVTKKLESTNRKMDFQTAWYLSNITSKVEMNE